MRKIRAVTGSRSDYYPFKPILLELNERKEIDLAMIVTGAHLSPEFGSTYRDIEADGLRVEAKIDMPLESNASIGIAKAMGTIIGPIAETYERLEPDLIIGLGDRYELLAAVTAALACRLPFAHVGGGDVTVGAFDDAIRHAITKMSHLHFPATDVERNRIIQMGESPDRVFAVGEPGLDTIRSTTFLTRNELSERLGIRFLKRNYLVTFHPVTTETGASEKQFAELLEAIDSAKKAMAFFTQANADPEGRIINAMIEDYAAREPNRTTKFKTLGDQQYLSIMKEVDAVVGNSSSGVIETPSLRVPTIDVGPRQQGRQMAASVIHCECRADAIRAALKQARSSEFQNRLKTVVNPYGDGHAAKRVADVLENIDLNGILKKKFHHS